MKLMRLPLMVMLLVPFVSFCAQVEQNVSSVVPEISTQPAVEAQPVVGEALEVPIVEEELTPTEQEIDETLNATDEPIAQPEENVAAPVQPIITETPQEPVAQEVSPAPQEQVVPQVEPAVAQEPAQEEKKEAEVAAAAPQATQVVLPEPNAEKIKEDIKKDLEVQNKEIKEFRESKKKKESKDKEVEVENVISSLDTLTVEDQGNWLLKRVWWEQAESTFEKIIDVNDQIIRLQGNYFNSRKESDKKITSYLRKLGYEEGQLNESLTFLLNQVESDRQLHGDLSVKEREFLELLNEKKKELEQLRTDIETLTNYDASINDVLTQLMAQVDRSRDFEKRAWEDFKEIGRVLNDKRAKVLFYQVDANLKNVQNILNFIKNDLNNHLNSLIEKSEQLAESIAKSVDSLEQQGINFKEQLENFKKSDAIKEQEKKQKEIEKQKEEAKRKKKGWFQSATDWVKSFF